MKYTDLVFDLYGTLVDIHTEEDDRVWEKTAFYFGFYGAHYTGPELKAAFQAAMRAREARAGQSYECFPDLPFEETMADLFRAKGVTENADTLGINAAQLFRISSLDYIRLYPHALEALAKLRKAGYRLWLLSNAQAILLPMSCDSWAWVTSWTAFICPAITNAASPTCGFIRPSFPTAASMWRKP